MNKEIKKLLEDWEQWEADLLDYEGVSLFDYMPTELYNKAIELQSRRNEILKDIRQEGLPNF